MSAPSGSTDRSPSTGDGYQISDNILEDLVTYYRSTTIRNEQQMALLTMAYVTGYLDDPSSYNSAVLIGTSSSGKTHVKDKIDYLFPQGDLYTATTGTDKSLIYDEDWDRSYIGSLDELQKPSEVLIEFLKSCHGGDEYFEYKITGQGQGKDRGAETIIRQSMPYFFLYAQWDADFEMWNRLMKISVHESESKNRAVGRMAFDDSNIRIEGDDVEYGFGFVEGQKAIRSHIASIKHEAPSRVDLPIGEEYDWNIWEVMEPIFKHGRSEVNRVYSMVANEIRGSALLNYHSREVVERDGEQHLQAEAQDVANVLMCRQQLLSTTHEIDLKKRAVCNGIKSKSGGTAPYEVEGVDPIIEYLRESDAPEVKGSELQNILEDLQDNFLVKIHEGAGVDGKADLYEFTGFDSVGFANVDLYPEQFKDCTDPFTGRPFMEAHTDYRKEVQFSGGDMLDRAMSGDGEPATSRANTSSSGRGGLSNFSSEPDEPEVELGDVEEIVLEHCVDTLDNTRIRNLQDVPVESFLGLVSFESDRTVGDVSGTILDPDHDVWDQPDRADNWVSGQTDARNQVKEAVKSLIDKKVIEIVEVFEQKDGSIVDAEVTVSNNFK